MKRFLVVTALALVAFAGAMWVHPPWRSATTGWIATHAPALAPYLLSDPVDETAKTAAGDGARPAGGGRTDSSKAPDGKGRPAGKGPPPPPVVATMVAVGEMPVILSAPGTVEARATVNVRPRVDGQIAEVLFREGDLVKAGQVLFRLDDRLVRAQIAQAEAQIKRDEAQLADAEGVYERRSALVQKRIVSESAMDTARANMEALKAAIAAGKANLDAQKTQLDYLTITAPITGRTGATTFKPGANVRAADTQALVVINQTQPVNVVFALPQTDLVALRRALDAKASAAIRIPVPNQPPVVRQGSLDFIDNQVDRTTGTLTAKVSSPNEDELLWPGLAVEVAVTVERLPNIASVPVSAVLPSQLGMICWVIGADNKVQPRPVVVARIVGQIAYIQDGLKGGERVVVDGQGRIAPGMTVQVTDPTSTGPAKGGKGGKGGETQADAPRG